MGYDLIAQIVEVKPYPRSSFERVKITFNMKGEAAFIDLSGPQAYEIASAIGKNNLGCSGASGDMILHLKGRVMKISVN